MARKARSALALVWLTGYVLQKGPLRDRLEDLPALLHHFLARHGAPGAEISDATLSELRQRPWPGNVRELENCIERAVLLCEEGAIHGYHLPPTLQTGRESGTLPDLSLEDAVATLEKEMIIDALKNTRGNITLASDVLKTTVRKFAYKAKKYGVDYRNYR